MADVQKVKILDVNTTKSVKNVKTLKQQIKELRDQLGMLEQGTEEYDRVAKQLADTNQKQIEVNEAMKYSNKDFGATMSNLTRVSAGVIGAFNGVSAAMQMMGADSEEAAEAMKNIQMTMALIQGLSAVDTAIKALKGLTVAFKDFNTETVGIQEKALQGKIQQTKAARDAETVSENLNAAAKKQNANATNEAAVAEGRLGGTIPKTMTGTGALTKVFKGLGSVLKSVVLAFGWVGVALAAVAAGVLIYTNRMKKLHKEEKELADMEAHLQNQYNENNIRLQALVNTAKDNTESVEERKKAIEELNKVVPNYNAKLNEETGAYEANTAALNDYLTNLKEKYRLEAYEGKIQENMQKQVELQEKLNKKIYNGWKGWNEFWGVTRKIRKEIRELDKDSERWFDKIKELDLTKALDENKVTSTTKAAGKSLKEIAKEIKAIYQTLVETIFDEREFTAIYNGVWDKSDVLLNRIKRNIRTKDFGTVIIDGIEQKIENSPNVQRLLNSSEHPVVTKFNVTADFIFGKDVIENIENELIAEEEKLKKKVDDNGKKLSDKELSNLKESVELRKTQLANMKALAEAVQEYADYQTELAEGQKERARAEDEYNETLRIEAEYIKAIRSGDRYAEIDKEIKSNELLLQTIYDRIAAEQQEYDTLRNMAVLNKQQSDRMDELDKKLDADRKARDNAERALDNANYKRRLEELKKFYEDSEKEYSVYIAELQSKRSLWGGGTEDYNTEYDVLTLNKQQLQKQLEYADWYYDTLIANAQGNAVELERLEVEKNGVMAELERQQAELEVDITKEKYARKINAAQTYFNALSSITGEIQGLLQEEMNGMDSNTKAYKEMRLTSARIDIASGILSAFMSGIQSGLPAPWNYGLAAAMATLVGITGAKQLENIRNENEANAMSASGHINIGTHYDTLSYQTQTDILSAIQDSRVYVLESDITSTQRRVRVAESQSTF